MLSTGNKELDRFRVLFYEYTFEIQDAFVDIPKYEDRLAEYRDLYIPELEELRVIFKEALADDEQLLADFFMYMEDEFDLIMLFNGFLGAPDQRKYGASVETVPFIIYPFQLVIGEVSERFNSFIKKCRDMGLSMLHSGIDAGKLIFAEIFECICVSEKQDKVHVVGDRTQTMIGRTINFCEESGLVDLKNFSKNIKLHLWRDKRCRIDGSCTGPTVFNGGRWTYARADEIGLYDSEQFLTEASQAVDCLAAFTTLCLGKDQGFRKGLKESYTLNYKKAFGMFRDMFYDDSCDLSYRDSWDNILERCMPDRKDGQSVRVDIDIYDHPLKTGECDFLAIESRKLLRDETAIAIQLFGDLTAGNTGRSLKKLNSHHFMDYKATDIMKDPANWARFTLHAGFDPGGHGAAVFVPMITDKWGFTYVLPAEVFETGKMAEWLQYLVNKYGVRYNQVMGGGSRKIHVYADEAISQYKDEGGLWWEQCIKPGIADYIDFCPYSNRGMTAMLMVVNDVLDTREVHPATRQIMPMVVMAQDNHEWSMGYEVDGKKTACKKQKGYSHYHDALVYALYNYYKQFPQFKLDEYYVRGA